MFKVHVRERPDRVNLQLAYTDPLTGTVRTKSAGTTDWKKAERAAQAWEHELRQGNGLVATGWDIFRTRFEDEYLPERSRSSRFPYLAALNHFENIIGHPRDLNSITPSVISRFRAALGKVVKSNVTVQKNLRHLRVALNWADEIGLMNSAPKISTTTVTRSLRGRPLSVFEFVRMYHAAPQLKWKNLLMCMWLSGMRLEESMQLSFSPPVQVELDVKYPRVRWRAEGHKARRDELVPITPAFARYLKRFKKTKGPIFPVGVLANEASKQVSEFGRLAGVKVSETKHASAQDLRRSFGQRWALKVHPFVLKKMMRHKSLKTTLAFYVDLDADEIAVQIWNAQNVHAAVHRSGFRGLSGDADFT